MTQNLWSRLRDRRAGFRVLRQHPVSHWIVDFYIPDLDIAIEIDGRSHEENGECDLNRQSELERKGVRFLRFTNDEVLHDLEGVVIRIMDFVALENQSAFEARQKRRRH